jgi:hypothetical protein
MNIVALRSSSTANRTDGSLFSRLQSCWAPCLLGILAASCVGCSSTREPYAHIRYFRWLETTPSRPVAVSLTGIRSDKDMLTLDEVAKGRLSSKYWFSKVADKPRSGGYQLELDCNMRTTDGTAVADISCVLWALGENNSRTCVAAGRAVQTAKGRFLRDAKWLKQRAFEKAINAILRTLAEEKPEQIVEQVTRRESGPHTVAPFDFRLCGNASEFGLGMAGTFVSNALTSSQWAQVLAPREFGALMKEINFAKSDTAQQRSRKLSAALKTADTLLFGTASEHGDCMEIDVRMVDVATGAVVGAYHGGSYRQEQLQSTCNTLINRLTALKLRPHSPYITLAVSEALRRYGDCDGAQRFLEVSLRAILPKDDWHDAIVNTHLAVLAQACQE